jgi:hypothetical protein
VPDDGHRRLFQRRAALAAAAALFVLGVLTLRKKDTSLTQQLSLLQTLTMRQ